MIKMLSDISFHIYWNEVSTFIGEMPNRIRHKQPRGFTTNIIAVHMPFQDSFKLTTTPVFTLFSIRKLLC